MVSNVRDSDKRVTEAVCQHGVLGVVSDSVGSRQHSAVVPTEWRAASTPKNQQPVPIYTLFLCYHETILLTAAGD